MQCEQVDGYMLYAKEKLILDTLLILTMDFETVYTGVHSVQFALPLGLSGNHISRNNWVWVKRYRVRSPYLHVRLSPIALIK